MRASAEQWEKNLVVVGPHHFGGDPSLSADSIEREYEAGGRIGRAVKSLRAAVDDLQRDLIRGALKNSGGNWAAVARELGVNRSNLHKLAKRLGVEDASANFNT